MDGVGREDLKQLMLHGRCHLFAAALHELTGKPLGAWLDTDLETEATVLVHACVLDGDFGIDVRGRMPLDDMLDEFDTFDPELAALSLEELMLLGHGTATVPEDDPEMTAARALAAETLDLLNATPLSSAP